MAKSIHERVRAKLAKAARDEQRKADRARDARMSRLERRDIAAEQRIIDLREGTVEPRTHAEWLIAKDYIDEL